MPKKRWMGTKPVRCDICGHKFGDKDEHFYDFATRQGPWALGCDSCFKKYGIGLGIGRGQKYDVRTLYKVEQAEKKKIGPVGSLAELKSLAGADTQYRKLLCLGSSNLGGPNEDMEHCYRWLVLNAQETTEDGVVAEVNACIDMV